MRRLTYPHDMHGFITLLPLWCALAVGGAADDIIVIDRAGAEIDRSCRVEIIADHLMDADGSGVIHITADDVTVDFAGAHLRGAAPTTEPDSYEGLGIVITGRNVTLRNARVSGFRGGIIAREADGLVIEDCDISDNYRARLRSTPQAEDAADWIHPHHNDNREWLSRYGAGMYIERSDNVTIRRVFARHGQNAIILDRVNDSRIYDNDCSFLSGWGLALWRSSRNIITRNAFDFCIRGYSHGVYNRGQDSAGILFFEQCSDNLVAENSATHGGDGFFGFAGLEAMGETWVHAERERLRREHERDDVDDLMVYPADLLDRVHRAGNNRNLLINNDFSYAAAHGIEMTFSFENRFIGNRLVGNAICGVWGGYSQHTLIANNEFEDNGEGAYGLERGGVNIEHGIANRIIANTFRNNKCGIHLWWDPDDHLMLSPWAKANHPDMPRRSDGSIERTARAEGRMVPSAENEIIDNIFEGDILAIQLRETDSTMLSGNEFRNVEQVMDAENEPVMIDDSLVFEVEIPEYEPLGETQPLGARAHLVGRERILMTEWGPYDWESPLLHAVERRSHSATYRLLGIEGPVEAEITDGASLNETVRNEQRWYEVSSLRSGRVTPYTLTITTPDETLTASGMLVDAEWRVRVFAYETDPRENVEQWRRESEGGIEFTSPHLQFHYGHGGPSQLAGVPDEVREAGLPRNRFGTIATTSIELPAGAWRLRTISDDGIRVWVDGEVVIDDWTWHAPRRHHADITLEESKTIEIHVEHFELDGLAILSLELEAM